MGAKNEAKKTLQIIWLLQSQIKEQPFCVSALSFLFALAQIILYIFFSSLQFIVQKLLLYSIFNMFSSLAFSVPLLLAGLQATVVGAASPISAVGNKFFYGNGTQFYIKGT
jgi:hypothetical protein